MSFKLPKGFKAAGIACGIKKAGKSDLSLIYSEVPAVAAGVFTTNQVKGNPVLVSYYNVRKGIAQAIISNAGNANTWTGAKGLRDACEMVFLTGKALGIPAQRVLVTSTGVIGQPLPMPKVRKGIKAIVKQLSVDGLLSAAKAIMTTDTRPKGITLRVGGITLCGIAKGSGMIEPGMATMHAFITTDALIDHRTLDQMLKTAVDKSFNLISVDNCMSTSDCVFVLANGMSGARVPSTELRASKGPFDRAQGKQGSRRKFYQALEKICIYLAKEIARDGEGATKLLEVKVTGAANEKDGRKVAKALTGNFLLKAAVYGKDRNEGRILQAVGSTTAKVNWDKFKFNWKMGKTEDVITVNLAAGKTTTTAWGCDLTEGYVKINAKYNT